MSAPRRGRRTSRALGLACGAVLFASVPGLPAGQVAPPPAAEKRVSTVVLPILFYMPETRWGGGAGGIVTIRPAEAGPARRPSSVIFSATVTQNKQFELYAKPELYLAGDSVIVTGMFDGKKYPSRFFGIGNDAPESAGEDFTPRQISLELAAAKRIWKDRNVFAGVTYLFESTTLLSLDPAGRLAGGGTAGSGGGVTSGAGAVLKWDSRDNTFFPRAGCFHQISAVVYGRWLGSDYGFTRLKTDLRTYLPVGSKHTLALQAYLVSVFGTAPFTSLPMFGADNTMRGYYGGRLRDNHMAAVQAEYRLPLVWRLGFVGFAGVGRVAGRLGGLGLSGFKGVAGWGLRFRVNREGANIRLDFGYGKGTSGIYFTAGEAF
jgi:outer membrane protein assembly factor BamA